MAALMKGRKEVQPEKISEVEEIAQLLKQYTSIGVVNMYKMPAAQLQQMKIALRGKAKIRMAKRRIVLRAMEKAELKGLEQHYKGEPALIFTNDNPFKIFNFIERNKTQAPAKAGDIAPKNIVVPAGNTNIPPGPAIGQLAIVGARASVKEGKIHVMQDSVVTKTGQPITPEVVSVLNMLNIQPMEIGLDLVVMQEKGLVYTKDVMRIDEVEFNNRLMTAIRAAFNLSINTGYLTKESAPLAVQKAYKETMQVAAEAKLGEKGLVGEELAKAASTIMPSQSQTSEGQTKTGVT